MTKNRLGLLLVVVLLQLSACSFIPKPPVAEKTPHQMVMFGDTRIDLQPLPSSNSFYFVTFLKSTTILYL